MPSIGSLCVCYFYIFIFYLTNALLKSDIFWHSKSFAAHSFQPIGIELHSLWRGKGAYYQLSRHTYKLEFFFYKFLKFLILPPKSRRISKNSLKFIIHFFHKKTIGHMYICTKCNDNFKFTISLKLNGAKDFIAVPPNACLFSITHFLYSWQKIFMNKNIFSKHDQHVLFISFFSKMYNKKLLFIALQSP